MRRVTIDGGAKGTKSTHLAALETNLFHQLHQLVAHCALTKYDDGEPRQPGWIVVRTQGAIWQCTAKDPDGAASLSATGQTIDDAFALLSMLLEAPDAPWEPDRWLMKGRTGGKKSG